MTSKTKSSAEIALDEYLKTTLFGFCISRQERERRRLGRLKLDKRLSKIPFYSEGEENYVRAGGTARRYWMNLYASSINL